MRVINIQTLIRIVLQTNCYNKIFDYYKLCTVYFNCVLTGKLVFNSLRRMWRYRMSQHQNNMFAKKFRRRGLF